MMQLNTQPIEKRDFREDGSLDVHSVWLTVQGEGPHAGRPAVFVRLAGCNLMCPGCDTDYTSKRKRMSANALFDEIEGTIPPDMLCRHVLIVFTGGEPLRQNLKDIILILQGSDYDFQIETNGAFPPIDLDYYDSTFYVISPKTPSINKDIQSDACAFKYIVQSGWIDDRDGLPTMALGGSRPARPSSNFHGNIYLQPMDEQDPEKNKANIQATVDSCLKFGYRISLQMHKILGLP